MRQSRLAILSQNKKRINPTAQPDPSILHILFCLHLLQVTHIPLHFDFIFLINTFVSNEI